MNSNFLFISCQVGAEKNLKDELARNHPELRSAFSRPGFVTFKSPEPLDLDFKLKSVFARASALSFGKTAEPTSVFEFAAKLAQGKKLRLHVWERDPQTPEKAAEFEAKLRALDSGILFEKDPLAKTGDIVLDVVWVDPGQWWYGAHLASNAHAPYAGALPKIALPEEAPSRAYLKVEEALLWSQAPLRKTDTVVEIGSAPGGAAYALLKRGLTVVGIDPGQLDPKILAIPTFQHLRQPMASVRREDLPAQVHWLFVDVNLAPRIALTTLDRLASRMRDSLLGMFLTLKLNEDKTAEEIPELLEVVRSLGQGQELVSRVRATQLSSNRSEIFVYASTRKGSARAKP